MGRRNNPLKGIIFDCDGVVVDSWGSTRYFFNCILKGVGLPPMTPDQERFVFVSTVEEGMAHIVPEDRLAEARKVKDAITVQELLPHLTKQAGLRGFLDFLRARGVSTAVNTNGGRENREILAALGLLDRFDMVVTTDDVARGKPDPLGVRMILQTLDLAHDQVAFIGDSHVDRDTAAAAGLRFWAYCNTALEAEVHVSGFAELQAWMAAAIQWEASVSVR